VKEPTIGIERDLSCQIERSLGSAYFVALVEAESLLPGPRVDNAMFDTRSFRRDVSATLDASFEQLSEA
jgi:hypothetical protein